MAQLNRKLVKDPHRIKDSYYYMVKGTPFARIYKVNERWRKGNRCWSYSLTQLPVECVAIYRTRKEVICQLEAFIGELDKVFKTLCEKLSQ